MNPFWVKCELPGRLAIVPRPRGGDWLADDLGALRSTGIDVLVSLLTPEEAEELGLRGEQELSHAQSLRFISFPILDRSVPASPAGVDNLIKELKVEMAAGRAIGIHCRAGIGRSALVAACLLTKEGVTPKEAFERISAARRCPVPDTSEQAIWVESFLGRRTSSGH